MGPFEIILIACLGWMYTLLIIFITMMVHRSRELKKSTDASNARFDKRLEEARVFREPTRANHDLSRDPLERTLTDRELLLVNRERIRANAMAIEANAAAIADLRTRNVGIADRD